MHASIVGGHAGDFAKGRRCITDVAPFVSRFLLVLLFVSLPVLGAWAAHEGDKECPNESGWKPSKSKLQAMLNEHKNWLDVGGWQDTKVAGKAILCKTDLSSTGLAKANLRYADLRGADLIEAKLMGADLSGANLDGVKLKGAFLIRANLHAASFVALGPHSSSLATQWGELGPC